MATRFTLLEFSTETGGLASAIFDVATATTQQERSAAVAGVISSASSIAAAVAQLDDFNSPGASYGFGMAAAAFGAGAFAYSAQKASDL